jgi:hypothetical protein
MSDLEVHTVGQTVNKQFLDQLAATIHLPAEVCGALLKAGWALEVKQNQPAMWVQAYPNRDKYVEGLKNG